jgi:excisionase family DNA binding protein
VHRERQVAPDRANGPAVGRAEQALRHAAIAQWARATFWGAKPIIEVDGSARWRRTAPERRRLVSTDHYRFQEETHEPYSPSASTAESRCAHESSGASAPRCATPNPERGATWLTYEQAARYAGWSVGHLRNLVSAGQIPVYGIRRRRRFRRDMLDTYLTDPDMAMRRFSAEGNSSHGR